MHFSILERSLTPEGHLYALVGYWLTEADFDAGLRPERVNDFIMGDASATKSQIVRDGRGQYKLIDGTFVATIPEDARRDEFEWEDVARDLLGDLVPAIEAHWTLAEDKGFVSERDNPAQVRSETDTRGGVLAAFDTSPQR